MEEAKLGFERRHAARVPVNLSVRCRTATAEELAQFTRGLKSGNKRAACYAGRTRDISTSGVFLVLSRCPMPGELLWVEIVLENSAQPLEAYAEVIWFVPSARLLGCFNTGIRFLALRPEIAKELEAFISHFAEPHPAPN